MDEKKNSEAQGGHICDLWSFAKIRDRLPKLGISFKNNQKQDIKRGLPKIGIK